MPFILTSAKAGIQRRMGQTGEHAGGGCLAASALVTARNEIAKVKIIMNLRIFLCPFSGGGNKPTPGV
jgi:hypothetical protein